MTAFPLLAQAAAVVLAMGCLGCAGPYHAGDAWNGYEEFAVERGRMRLERDPEGFPVSNLALAENFRRIAFGIEADVLGPDADDPLKASPGVLRRWEQPVRWQVTSLGPRAGDHRRMVRETAARLAAATGHDIAETGAGELTNLAILFLRPDDYAPAAAALRRRPAGGWLAVQVDRFGRAGHAPCVGLFLHSVNAEAGTLDQIVFGLALIRDGLPPRLARACVEEELAQTMGLPNDDDYVRPSVFNDDQEFALLTLHDEALLRILYDPRLAAGMSEAEAMALVPRIIGDLDTARISGRAPPGEAPR